MGARRGKESSCQRKPLPLVEGDAGFDTLSIISVSCDTHGEGHQTFCGWLGRCHRAVWQVTAGGSGTGNHTPGKLCFPGEQRWLLASATTVGRSVLAGTSIPRSGSLPAPPVGPRWDVPQLPVLLASLQARGQDRRALTCPHSSAGIRGGVRPGFGAFVPIPRPAAGGVDGAHRSEAGASQRLFVRACAITDARS